MNTRLVIVLTTIILTGWLWLNAGAETVRTVFKKVDGAVLIIHANYKDMVAGVDTKFASVPGIGSGVLISADGKVLTAAHVVQTADEIVAEFRNGQRVSARILSSDPAADVALIQLEKVPPGAVIAKLGDSDATEVGDQVFIVGAPLGLGYTLTVGHISARNRPNIMYSGMARAEFFQTDAAINQGNSGGPMFNMQGEVIGIVSHILSKSGGSEGLGFVVTADAARRVLLEMNPYWSGVEGYLLAGDLARAFNVPQPAGMLIQRVSPKSPAAQIGLRPGSMPAVINGQSLIVGGDVVLEVQGVPIVPDGSSYAVIRDRLGQLKKGEEIRIVIIRGGEKKNLFMRSP